MDGNVLDPKEPIIGGKFLQKDKGITTLDEA